MTIRLQWKLHIFYSRALLHERNAYLVSYVHPLQMLYTLKVYYIDFMEKHKVFKQNFINNTEKP